MRNSSLSHRIYRIFLVIAIVLLSLNLDPPWIAQGDSGDWISIGRMPYEAAFEPAVLLPNGKVLIVGYSGYGELYDFTTAKWTVTGRMLESRFLYTATLLPNGKVLAAGGMYEVHSLASAELYDPVTGEWMETGSMAFIRSSHTATLLPNGKVLVAGGSGNTNTELYDPETGEWSQTGSMHRTPAYHTATLLPNGKVLVAGGYDVGTDGPFIPEVYDPSTGVWTETSSMTAAWVGQTATLLPNGKVLVIDGSSGNVYDSIHNSWTATASLTTSHGWGFKATLLQNGKVLVTGGVDSNNSYNSSSEIYDPATDAWTEAGNMNVGRMNHTATLLPDGSVLVAGGGNYRTSWMGSAELYDAKPAGSLTMGNLIQRYDGQPKAVSVTTDPPGMTVNVTYTGIDSTFYGPSSIPPSESGIYEVVAVIFDQNYKGRAINTLLIAKSLVILPEIFR